MKDKQNYLFKLKTHIFNKKKLSYSKNIYHPNTGWYLLLPISNLDL